MGGTRTLRVRDLGRIEYAEALALQRALREERLAGRVQDTLLLAEHPPVITLGRRSDPAELLASREALSARGFRVFEVERGGKTTYHGPGQLVAYPILSLRELALGVPEFVSLIEQALIDYLSGLGLRAERRPGFPGVWVGGRKIAAIGVHLKRWVSMHGLSLNLSPDLRHYQAIVACGIADSAVTSIAAELGHAPSVGEAQRGVAEAFARVFGYSAVEWVTATPLHPPQADGEGRAAGSG